MAAHRLLVVARADLAGAPLVAAVDAAVRRCVPAAAGDAVPMVHVTGFAFDAGIARDGADALREAELADTASWLGAAVARVDSRGVDVTFEAAWSDDPVAWVAACVQAGGFTAVVLPGVGGDDPEGARWHDRLRAALPGVPVLYVAAG